MNKLVNIVAKYHNIASDSPIVWFPFFKLKPQSTVPISFQRTIIMAICFGSYFNLAYLAKELLFQNTITTSHSLQSHAWFTLGFLIWFNLVTKPLWNIRASLSNKAKQDS